MGAAATQQWNENYTQARAQVRLRGVKRESVHEIKFWVDADVCVYTDDDVERTRPVDFN